MAKLLIDDRERAVTLHMAEFKTIPHEILRIENGGDYIVISDQNILAIIERKSLEDFAASIKDGRSKNIDHLVQFRARTGCRIIYLIEGKLNPHPTDTFGRIPYKTIESSIFHLIVRDGICVMRTSDTLDTAQQLVRLIQSMNTLKDTKIEEIPTTPHTIFAGNEIIQLIKEKHVKSDLDSVREMWAAFRGITAESADNFIKIWSLSDIILERIPREVIREYKWHNGRKLAKPIADSLLGCDNATSRRMLSRVPGISTISASYILDHISLRTLLGKSAAELGEVNYTNKKKLNVKQCESIIKLFNYKDSNQLNSDPTKM